MGSLRQKLQRSADEVLIQTEGSAGYRLMLPMPATPAASEIATPRLAAAA
jgi:hypothetical protein